MNFLVEEQRKLGNSIFLTKAKPPSEDLEIAIDKFFLTVLYEEFVWNNKSGKRSKKLPGKFFWNNFKHHFNSILKKV